MEENRIRKALLSSLYSNKGEYQRSCLPGALIQTDPLGHELSGFDMHLSRSQSAGACWNGGGVRSLRWVVPPFCSVRKVVLTVALGKAAAVAVQIREK